jgi:hypothetical protein
MKWATGGLYTEFVKQAFQKHLAPSSPVKTSLFINATDMSFTGYIVLREPGSKKIFSLKELVQAKSNFHFSQSDVMECMLIPCHPVHY